MALLAILSTVAAGCLILLSMTPIAEWKPGWAAWLLALSLGAGLGIAIDSSLFFLLLLLGVPGAAGALPYAVLLAAAAVFWSFRARRTARPVASLLAGLPESPAFAWNWALGLAFAIGLLLVLLAFFASIEANPHGQWDAWAIWNVRAKYLAGPGQTWKYAISPLLSGTHPEYPLLLSSFIALLWKGSGAYTPSAPIATALLFLASTLGLLVSALALLRSTSAAWLAGLVALANTSYMLQSATQYADVPLSFYYLAALVLVFLARAAGRPALLVAAGLFVSCAACTKNEGIAFLACVLVCYPLAGWRSRGLKPTFAAWLYLLLGALPGLMLSAWFKLVLAPAADPLFAQKFSQVLPKFADPSRYAQIAKALSTEVLNLGIPEAHPLLLLAILAFALRFRIPPGQRPEVLFAGLVLLFVGGAYTAAYLASPSLSWQLGTSLGRLCAQAWPAFLLPIFMLLGRIEDRTAGPPR
ncbi:MAG: hypothetical protein ACLQGV_06125 [Bryobacteraceae bacterium]